MTDMQGRVALITGAGSGIGRATAVAFAARGAHVIAADVDDAGNAETVALIRAAGGRGDAVRADVSLSSEVQAMVAFAVDAGGRLDYAVNNAGIGGELSFHTADYPEEAWHRLLSINLTGVYLCMKYEIPRILETGAGCIVNMASVLGTVGLPGAVAYTAAKHGVMGLTKTAALEYGPQGLRITALCPGFISTPLIQQGGIHEGDDTHRAIAGLHALKRWGTAEEVAAAAVWLCSDEAFFVTGAGVLVDGGYTAQ